MSENATDPKTQLIDNLKELHLPAMRSGFEEVAQRAQQESQSYERYLLELTERECQGRRGNRIERLLKDSRLPLAKTLQSLDLKRLPVKVVQQVRALVDGTFADRRENVLAFGNPGSGKTHVLSAISHTLIRSGRRVYFRNCGLMVQDLLAAKRDLKLSGLFKRLSRYEVLVLDDLGYVQQYSGPRKLDHRLSYSDGPANGRSDGEEAEGPLTSVQVSGRPSRSQGRQDDQRVGRALRRPPDAHPRLEEAPPGRG